MTKNIVKKTLQAVSTAVAGAAPLTVFAQDRFGVNYGINAGLGTRDVRDTVVGIINVALGILGIVALIIILWGGLTWMTAGGNEEKTGQARKIIASGVIGLIVIFVAYALTTFVFGVLENAT